ncbi:PREDICTED: uncharacterized protein LOC104698943 [Camelina sativa]|uniref:Uncharacterized protein LOC104698943 n=1 Tax=Camelina sativa TaxID=90675 RepID=A0ABM0SKT1_CAMSA|nr:PREDICTED: uncharacterized protein LOC104698943 [Camelina sativa]
MATPTNSNSPETTTNPNVVETRRTISRYDLTAADNSGAVISHPLLKGSNYDEWACGMKTALSSRKKFGFLDGSIARPNEGSSDLDDWWTIQALLVSWIKISIDPSLRSSISYRDVAKDLWDTLKKRFSVTNGPRIQQLKAELACCKQRCLAIEAYFGKLNRIWDNMAHYRPLRVCKCGKCECDLGTLQEQDREGDKVHEFLSGFDDNYHTVRSTLVSRMPLHPLEEVYNVVRQEEDLKTNARLTEPTPEVAAHAVQVKPRSTPFRTDVSDPNVVCKHCKHSGHSSDNCFAVLGYPKWWVHVPPTPNSHHANYTITDADRNGVSGLNDDQWRMLMNLLNGGAITSTEKVSGNFELLTAVCDMPPVLVILVDGRERVSTKEGTVVLRSNLVLKSVYFVEALTADLIAVGQLMDENRCVIQLADHFLVIQDRVSRTVIGAGKRDSGTFYFRRTELVAAVRTREDTSYELWHHRLGHPSAQVVGSLKNISVGKNSLPWLKTSLTPPFNTSVVITAPSL